MHVYQGCFALYSESILFKSQFFWNFSGVSFSPHELPEHVLKWPITMTFLQGSKITTCSLVLKQFFLVLCDH